MSSPFSSAPSDPSQPAFAESRDAIARWLRRSGIQQVDGPDRGGIAGKLDAQGRRSFLYGEITGYWLRWASIYAPEHQPMAAAVDFLHRQWSSDEPAATRVGAADDWRNGAVFSFDLAMMLRGLADAVAVVGESSCARASAGIVAWLDRMIDGHGMLLSHVALGAAPLPTRWSTLPGPFQAKTAAAILAARRHWLSPALERAAQTTLARWRDRPLEQMDLHPRFYAIEGHALAGGQIDPVSVLADRTAAGWFPERAATHGSRPRGDIQAQALRLLCLAGAPQAIREDVATSLLRHMQADGSVRCHLDEAMGNVWCAMFAHQALDWLNLPPQAIAARLI
jgi:hypothetical protein